VLPALVHQTLSFPAFGSLQVRAVIEAGQASALVLGQRHAKHRSFQSRWSLCWGSQWRWRRGPLLFAGSRAF